MLAFGERLRATRNDAAAFLRRVQTAHPADFWANLIAGNAMLQSAPQEAAGYYRAALASRPQAPVGYCAVGDTLRLQQLPEQAIDYYQKALQIDPDYARAYSNLGAVLQDQGRLDDAIHYFQKALQLDPDYAWAHRNFASALRMTGRLDEAYEHYQQVLRVDPQNPMLTSASGSASPAARVLVRKMLARWQADPDLAGLRRCERCREAVFGGTPGMPCALASRRYRAHTRSRDQPKD